MRVYQASLLRVVRVRFSPDARTVSILHSRSNRIAHVDLTSGDTRPNTRSDHGGITNFAHSADGRLLAVATSNGFVQAIQHGTQTVVMNLGVETETCLGPSRPERSVQFTPAGESNRSWLAVAGEQLCLWNSYSQEYIFNPDDGDYRGTSFGPDGSTLASIEAHAHCLTVWDVKPFRVRFRARLAGLDPFTNGSVAVLPDADRIVYAAGDKLRCVSMTGWAGWELKLKKPVLDLALHPSGQGLLVADGTKKVTQMDADSGRPSQEFDWGVGKVSCVDISHDGTLFAAGGEKGQVVVWDGE